MLPPLTFAQLRLFRAVMLAGSISGGARATGMSQPSASRMIRRLQDQVGYRLFASIRGRTVPTDEAVLLFREVAAAFDRLDRVADVARRLGSGARPEPLVIGSPTAFAMTVLPGVAYRLRQAFPSLPVTLDARNFVDQVRAIERGDMHVGVGIAADVPLELERSAIGEQRLFVLLPRDHALAGSVALGLECLGRHDCIMGLPSAAMASRIDGMLHARGVVPKAVLRTGSLALSAALVRTFGIPAIVDGITARAAGDDLTSIPLSDTPPMPIHACWKAGAPPSRVRDRLLDLLRDALLP